MAVDEYKYTQAVLFFVTHCNQYLGITKLNKLFYYLDFISYRDTGHSVTGDNYLSKKFGPVPELLESKILLHMEDVGILNKQMKELSNGNRKTSFSTLKKINLDTFSSYEQELLKYICKEFKSWNTDMIVEQTHMEAPWFYAEEGKLVDYNYSNDIQFFLKGEVTA